MDDIKCYTNWIKLMKFGKRMGCHQIPERSFFIHGYQFPVCARCTGVIIATIGSIPIFFIMRIKIKICIYLCLIMFADWFLQFIGFRKSTNIRRFITGILGGFGLSTIYLYVIRNIYEYGLKYLPLLRR